MCENCENNQYSIPDLTTGYCPQFQILRGIDKNWYAVFDESFNAETANEDYFGGDLRLSSFGSFENALQLTYE